MKKIFSLFYSNLYLNNRLFIYLTIVVVCYLLRFFFNWLGVIPDIAFGVLILLVIIDIILLYRYKKTVFAQRYAPERLSNNDENELGIFIENFYPFIIKVGVIDEVPVQFQRRNVWFTTSLTSGQQKTIKYSLRPTKRGEYEFGFVRVFVRSPLSLISRRINFDLTTTLPVYPSFIQMRKYELLAASNKLNEIGIKKIRRLGHSLEFEHVKNYVVGDDYRSINWKATARQGNFMVNSYIDERSQHVYCIIDKSRAMKMPFNGLSLLDYAINASLVLSKVALLKEDKAGLITIAEKKGTVIAAERKPVQINRILEALYKEKTRYLEANMEILYSTIRATIKQRSLLVFFTNYESISSLRRQLPFLQRIAKFHLLLIVFFDNTELKEFSAMPATNVEDIYIKTTAQKFVNDKKLIVMELAKYGIQALLTSPQELTVATVNKYLELKAKQKI